MNPKIFENRRAILQGVVASIFALTFLEIGIWAADSIPESLYILPNPFVQFFIMLVLSPLLIALPDLLSKEKQTSGHYRYLFITSSILIIAGFVVIVINGLSKLSIVQ